MSEPTIKEILKTFIKTCSHEELIINVFDEIRDRKDIAFCPDPITHLDMLEMKAEDEQHFRGLVTQIQKDIENEPA